MTAIAVLDIIFGVVGFLAGLFNLLGAFVLFWELLRLGVFEIPMARLTFSLLLLATGIVGLIAGLRTLALRPSARTLNLVYAGLLIASAVVSYFTVPIIGTIGTYDIGSISAEGLARLIIFGFIYVAFPVPYSAVLCAVFSMPAWKAAFATGGARLPPLASDEGRRA